MYQNKDKIGNYLMDNFVILNLFSYIRAEMDSYFEFQLITIFFIIFLLEASFPI